MKELKFVSEFRVKYADTDRMGYLYNGNYLTLFEVGRTELMRNYGMTYFDLEKAGIILPLIDSYVKYIQPAYYDDLLYIEARLNYEYTVRCKFDYNILRNNTIITTGYTQHAFVNIENRKVVRPPKLFTDIIDKIT